MQPEQIGPSNQALYAYLVAAETVIDLKIRECLTMPLFDLFGDGAWVLPYLLEEHLWLLKHPDISMRKPTEEEVREIQLRIENLPLNGIGLCPYAKIEHIHISDGRITGLRTLPKLSLE